MKKCLRLNDHAGFPLAKLVTPTALFVQLVTRSLPASGSVVSNVVIGAVRNALAQTYVPNACRQVGQL